MANAACTSCCGVQVNHKRIYRLYRAAGLMVRRRRIAVARFRGYPQAIRTDQGPEFTGKALDQWACQRDVKLKLIQPGQPTQSAFIESFNGKFRGECLNEHCSLVEARIRIAAWRDYNEHRPHSAIGNLSPAEFAAKWRTNQQQLKREKLISTP